MFQATTLTFKYKINSEPRRIGPIRRTECQSFVVSCTMNRETVIETPNGANVTEKYEKLILLLNAKVFLYFRF